MEELQLGISKYREVIHNSKFFKEVKETVPVENGYTKIRCLALGSPSESSDARYQYAFLLELMELLNITQVSLYDPVFTELDKQVFASYVVEEFFEPKNDDNVLHYIPHAPLSVMEQILKNEKPTAFLGNDIIAHTDRLTKRKLADLYPSMAILVHYSKTDPVEDGFVKVLPKSRNNQNTQTNQNKRSSRNGRKSFKEPEIEYDLNSVYFDGVEIKRYKHNYVKGDVWGNSFSDIAFHKIHTRK